MFGSTRGRSLNPWESLLEAEAASLPRPLGPDEQTAATLAERHGLSHAAAERLLKKLEREGKVQSEMRVVSTGKSTRLCRVYVIPGVEHDEPPNLDRPSQRRAGR
jgi:hypothetical protein